MEEIESQWLFSLKKSNNNGLNLTIFLFIYLEKGNLTWPDLFFFLLYDPRVVFSFCFIFFQVK